MICDKCGSKIDQNFAYCPYCGLKVKKDGQKQNRNVKKRGNGQGTVFKQNGKWIAQVTVGWKPDGKRISLSRTFEKKTDAIQALPNLRKEYNPSPLKPEISFADCFEQMMAQHRKRIGTSAEENYYYAFKHFAPIEYMRISDVKTAQLQQCVDSTPGKSMQTKMKAAASLTFKFAMQNDIVEKNYAEFITISRTEEAEREPFNAEEIQKIVNSAASNRYAAYIAVLVFTGMRPNEMFLLTKSDYHGTYFIGGSKTAAGRNRLIPIPAIIQPMVSELAQKSKSEFIFSAPNGDKMDLTNFRKRYYYPLLEELGIRKLPPYCCRHTFATMLKSVNAPITDKQRVMGHSSFTMTAHYTHSDIESVQAVADGITQHYIVDIEKAK